MGDAGADLGVLVGIAEEIHHLLQLLLFLVGACHIVEGDLLVVRHTQHRSGLAKLVHGVAAVHAAHDHGPGQQQHTPHHQQRNDIVIGGIGARRDEIVALQHPGGRLLVKQRLQLLPEQLRIGQAAGDGGLAGIGLPQLQGDGIPLHDEGFHLLRPEECAQVAVGNGVALLAERPVGPAQHQCQNQGIYNQRNESSAVFQW